MRSIDTKEFKKAMIDADFDTFGKLEEATGIDRTSLGNYAKGDQKPGYDSIAKMSDAMHLSYEEIGRIFFYREITEA